MIMYMITIIWPMEMWLHNKNPTEKVKKNNLHNFVKCVYLEMISVNINYLDFSKLEHE